MSYLWSDPAFLDFACREPFGLLPSQLGTSCTDPTGYPRALSLLSRLLHRLASEPSVDDVFIPPWLRNTFGKAQQHFGFSHGNPAWDTSSWSRLSSLVHTAQFQTSEQVTALVSETIGRINSLQPGGIGILPGGIAIDTDKPPVFFLFIIRRPEDRPQFFEFTVVNSSGFGTEFHAFQLDDCHPSTGSVQRDFLLVLENVIPERLVHSSFWVCVYCLLTRPAPTNIHTFYTILLPHLNCQPLLSNWISLPSLSSDASQQRTASFSKESVAALRHGNGGGAWFVAPALRSPGSCLPGALACLHYILQTSCHLHCSEIRVMFILLWWAVCLACRDDLALVTTMSSEGNNSVSDACSAFHLTVVKCAMRYAVVGVRYL